METETTFARVTAKKAASSSAAETKGKTDKNDADSMYRYTEGCNIFVADKDAGLFDLTWDDGKSLKATRGATIDYIPAHLHIHLTRDDGIYSPADDYDAMVEGGVDPKMALIIMLMRQVAVGIEGIAVNASETVYVQKSRAQLKLPESVQTILTKNGPDVSSIVQQSISILALNGISLISRGHHYNEADQFWGRLEASTNLTEKMAAIRINNWNGLLYHDAMHVFDYDYVASLVTSRTGGVETHVNGVVLKRLGTMPAGTTILGIIVAMIDAVSMYNVTLGSKFRKVKGTCEEIAKIIRRRPLDYCVHFKRDGINARLAHVASFEPVAVFLFGYLRAVEPKKSTLTSAKSVDNLAKRHQDMYILGTTAADAFKVATMTADEISDRVGRILENVEAAREALNTENRNKSEKGEI